MNKLLKLEQSFKQFNSFSLSFSCLLSFFFDFDSSLRKTSFSKRETNKQKESSQVDKKWGSY